jgi:hypothetical protein
MKIALKASAVAAIMCMASAGEGQAAVTYFGLAEAEPLTSADITSDFSPTLVRPVASDAQLKLTVNGNFSTVVESLSLRLDFFDLGVLFDDIPDNDLFDLDRDRGNTEGQFLTTTATIPQSVMASIAADGAAALKIHVGRPISNSENSFLTADLTYVTPIPAAAPLLASALGGLGFFGWRRRSAASA